MYVVCGYACELSKYQSFAGEEVSGALEGWGDTYQVSPDDLAVEVDLEPEQADADPQPLGPSAEGRALEGRGQGVRGEHAAGRVEPRQDVVFEDLLDDLLGRLVSVLGDLLEGLVDGDEDGDVGLGAVQQGDDVGEVVDEGRELLGVVGGLDGLVDGQVRGAVVAVPRPVGAEDVVGVLGVEEPVDVVEAGGDALGDAVEELMRVLLDEVERALGRRAQRLPPCRRCCRLSGFLDSLGWLLNLQPQLLGRRIIGDDDGRG